MAFHKWFLKQSLIVKVLLLIIPVVGWFVEVVMRISALLAKGTTSNILGLILYIILGVIMAYVDVLFCLLGQNPLLLED